MLTRRIALGAALGLATLTGTAGAVQLEPGYVSAPGHQASVVVECSEKPGHIVINLQPWDREPRNFQIWSKDGQMLVNLNGFLGSWEYPIGEVDHIRWVDKDYRVVGQNSCKAKGDDDEEPPTPTVPPKTEGSVECAQGAPRAEWTHQGSETDVLVIKAKVDGVEKTGRVTSSWVDTSGTLHYFYIFDGAKAVEVYSVEGYDLVKVDCYLTPEDVTPAPEPTLPPPVVPGDPLPPLDPPPVVTTTTLPEAPVATPGVVGYTGSTLPFTGTSSIPWLLGIGTGSFLTGLVLSQWALRRGIMGVCRRNRL
jgi:hypothetical protein